MKNIGYGKKFLLSEIQAEVNKSVVSVHPDSGYKSFFLYIRATGVEETQICEGPNTWTLDGSEVTVPENMTLIVPSSQVVAEFFGDEMMSRFLNP